MLIPFGVRDPSQHPTRVKLDLASRERDLAVAFSVTGITRWAILMGTEFQVNTADYMDAVRNQYAPINRLHSPFSGIQGWIQRRRDEERVGG